MADNGDNPVAVGARHIDPTEVIVKLVGWGFVVSAVGSFIARLYWIIGKWAWGLIG